MIKEFINLGRQPIANKFLTVKDIINEEFFELKAGFDEDTKLVSLINPPDKSKLFNKDYIYRSSGSATMRKHFKDVADQFAYRKVLEIGSNDGVMVSNLDPTKVVCVEPCSNMAQITDDKGYRTYCDYWDKSLAREIYDEHGAFDIVYAANCMCHIPNIQEAFQAVSRVLGVGGEFIFEDPCLEAMLLNNSYDQIYDEHTHIFSVEAVNKLLNNVGLYIKRVEFLGVHGGSHRYYVTNNKTDAPGYVKFHLETLCSWAWRVRDSGMKLQRLLQEAEQAVIAIGATSKSTVVYNYCGINSNLINYITDTTPGKQGLLSPGMHIPVVGPEYIDKSVKTVFLGAWNFADEIMANHKDLVDRGVKFITHVPYPRYL